MLTPLWDEVYGQCAWLAGRLARWLLTHLEDAGTLAVALLASVAGVSRQR